MLRKLAVVIIAIGICVSALFIACSGGKGELKIGAILPLTGDISNYGELIKSGMDLAVEEINADDGVDGDTLKIVYKDSQGKPEVATDVMIELTEKERVPLIIGGVSSTVSLTLAPIADDKQVVLLSPASSSPKLSGYKDYFFRIYPSDTLEGYSMANRILNYQQKGNKKYFQNVVVVASQTDYAEGIKIEFVKEFRRRGGNTEEVINYDPLKPEFEKVVSRVLTHMRDEAGAIFIAGYYEDIANFLLTLKKNPRFDPQAHKIFSCSAVYTPEFKKKAAEYFVPKDLDKYGLVFPVICHITPDSPDEDVAMFARRFYKKYGYYPESYAAHGYDAVKLVADVIERRGSMPRDIQFGLSIVKNWMGVAGKVTIDDNHDVSKYPVIYGYDGKEMLIFDTDYKKQRTGYYEVVVWE